MEDKKLEDYLPQLEFEILQQISKLAVEEKVFLVGGIVRDFILGKGSNDIDIVVEGNGILFAQRIQTLDPKSSIKIFNDFGTAKVEVFGIEIDVATARSEVYEKPGSLPKVHLNSISIQKDLERRDFTINCMAIQLNNENFGSLIDFYNGIQDLQTKTLRVLHNNSFVDDPTRIIREIRFEQRYKFIICENDLNLIANCLENKIFEYLSGSRLWHEFEKIFMENDEIIIPILNRIQELNIFNSVFDENLNFDNFSEEFSKILYCISKNDFPNTIEELFEQKKISKFLILLFPFLSNVNSNFEILKKILHQKFGFSEGFLNEFFEISKKIKNMIKFLNKKVILNLESSYEIKDNWNSKFCLKFESLVSKFLPYEAQFYIYALFEEDLKKEFIYFWDFLTITKCTITGQDLKKIGFTPGPQFKSVLHNTRIAKLDNKIHTKEEELEFAKNEFK